MLIHDLFACFKNFEVLKLDKLVTLNRYISESKYSINRIFHKKLLLIMSWIPNQMKLTQTAWNLRAQCDVNIKLFNANFIPPAHVGLHVGSVRVRIGSASVSSTQTC